MVLSSQLEIVGALKEHMLLLVLLGVQLARLATTVQLMRATMPRPRQLPLQSVRKAGIKINQGKLLVSYAEKATIAQKVPLMRRSALSALIVHQMAATLVRIAQPDTSAPIQQRGQYLVVKPCTLLGVKHSASTAHMDPSVLS